MSQPGSSHIRLKRVYDSQAPDDGSRLLVERLWPRGLARDAAAIDRWFKALAPSTELRRWYDHVPERWPEFRERYLAELEDADEEAIEELVALCRDAPHSFYALLAYGRLLELAPERAAEVAQRSSEHTTGDEPVAWHARVALGQDPHWKAGVALARLGLVQEAMAEFRHVERELTADEMAWQTELRIAAGDWLRAHDDLRDWIVEHPIGTLKSWMGYTHFLTRRLRGVSAEMSLNVLAYNLKRLLNLMGPAALTSAIQGS